MTITLLDGSPLQQQLKLTFYIAIDALTFEINTLEQRGQLAIALELRLKLSAIRDAQKTLFPID